MLIIKNLTKTYSKANVKALADVNLELKEGEIFGFLGPNGAGKTTAIRIITGILQFERGEVSICGFDIKKNSIEAKMNMGFVPDSHIIYDKLSGREYVDFMADIYGVDVSVRKERAEKMLKDFSLTDAFDSPIKSYSHGMKQKIAIIGALIHEPKLWILDEPLTGLDPSSAHQLKAMMREHCNKGNTVFFSTHILEVAEKLCDRIGIIAKGRMIMTGSVKEIISKSNDKTLEEVFLNVAGNDAAEQGFITERYSADE